MLLRLRRALVERSSDDSALDSSATSVAMAPAARGIVNRQRQRCVSRPASRRSGAQSVRAAGCGVSRPAGVRCGCSGAPAARAPVSATAFAWSGVWRPSCPSAQAVAARTWSSVSWASAATSAARPCGGVGACRPLSRGRPRCRRFKAPTEVTATAKDGRRRAAAASGVPHLFCDDRERQRLAERGDVAKRHDRRQRVVAAAVAHVPARRTSGGGEGDVGCGGSAGACRRVPHTQKLADQGARALGVRALLFCAPSRLHCLRQSRCRRPSPAPTSSAHSTSAPTPPFATTSCASSGVCLATSRTSVAAYLRTNSSGNCAPGAAGGGGRPVAGQPTCATYAVMAPGPGARLTTHYSCPCQLPAAGCSLLITVAAAGWLAAMPLAGLRPCTQQFRARARAHLEARQQLGEHLCLHHHLGQVHAVLRNLRQRAAHLHGRSRHAPQAAGAFRRADGNGNG